MSITRRELNLGLAGLLANTLGSQQALAAEDVSAAKAIDHDMSGMPANWTGKEQIAFLIYPRFTALDMVGAHHMLASLMGSTTHIVAKTKDPVTSDQGLVFTPSASFEDCPKKLDIICVPGGSTGTLAAMQDEATLKFLRHRGRHAKYVTSVCTGSLLLGAAGLLKGYKATSHWATREVLPVFGATPVDARVVRDRNRITGGGVTAGIDLGLTIVGMLRDTEYAQGVQLIAEYAPEPPYDAGTPDRAPANVKAMTDAMFVNFIKQAAAVGRSAYARSKGL